MVSVACSVQIDLQERRLGIPMDYLSVYQIKNAVALKNLESYPMSTSGNQLGSMQRLLHASASHQAPSLSSRNVFDLEDHKFR